MKPSIREGFLIDLGEIKKRFSVKVRQPGIKSRDCTLVVDNNFVIQMASPSARANLGITQSELIGKPIFNFINSKLRNIILRSLRNAWASDVYLFSLKRVKLVDQQDNVRYFDLMINLMEDEEQSFSFIINLHRVSADDTRERLDRVTRQLDRILYALSHDFRSPLLTALGLINLAQIDPDYDRFTYLEMIKDNILKLDHLTTRLSNLAKNQKSALKREWIDWNILVEESIARNMDEHVRVFTQLHTSTPFYTDLFRLSIIVNNLVSNAFHFSDPEKEDRQVEIIVQNTARHCTFTVRDNGVGIDPEHINRIFDLFYRGSLDSKGSGLGLYLVKNSVEILQGQMSVQSDPGKGTTFEVQLPNLKKKG